MRVWILALTAVSFVTLLTLGLSTRPVLGDEPAPAQPAAVSETVPLPPAANRRMWELDGALFKSFSGQNANQLGTARLTLRRFLNDSLSVGTDLRYWPAGSYPLTDDTSSGAWAVGGNGQLYLFKSSYIGAYLGGSLLWVPTYAAAAFAPEVGFKWFASQRVALGISYWILTDLGSYTTSFEPASTGRSRQNLGLEISVYL